MRYTVTLSRPVRLVVEAPSRAALLAALDAADLYDLAFPCSPDEWGYDVWDADPTEPADRVLRGGELVLP